MTISRRGAERASTPGGSGRATSLPVPRGAPSPASLRDSVRRAAPLVLAAAILAAVAIATPAAAAKKPGRAAANAEVTRLVERGADALGRGDLQAAKMAFESALSLAPRDVAANTYLGLLADREGDMKSAERYFAAAVAAAPDSASAHNNLGAALLKLGRSREAAAQFDASLRVDPRQPSALVNLGQIRVAEGTRESLTAARELFERAVAIRPDAEVSRALVVVALKQNDPVAAARYFRDAAPALASDASAARLELAGALLEGGLAAEAAEEVAPVVDAEPSNADAVVLLARCHLARKDLPAAGRTLESAVARGVDSGPVYALLAEVYESVGHTENAIPAMRLAIQADPKREEYRFRYGMMLTDTKAPGAAVIRLQEALEQFPSSAKLWFALGVAHVAEHKLTEAGEALRRAVALQPDLAPAYAYLGMTYTEAGDFDGAVDYYERALKVNEGLAAVHFLLADTLLKQNTVDVPRVERHLARAVELDASFVPARLALGTVYTRTERYADAAAQLERAVALDPSNSNAHYQLGRTYLKLGRKDEAQSEMGIFKKLHDAESEGASTEQADIRRRLANVRF